MPPILRIQLLGEFRLLLNELPLDKLDKPRQQALLAYILLHRHAPQARQQVAFSFWPDSSEGQAYTNLRKLHFQIRQALPAADIFLSATSLTLGWRQDSPFTLDVAELEQALERLEETDMPLVETVKKIVALYSGELLPTCYDDWILPIRRQLHERVINALTQAVVELGEVHEYPVALRTAEHLLRLDPLHEATYRQLMHLRALSGDRAGALRIYHECVTMLEQELGVAPATETQVLYQQLLKAEPQRAPAPAAMLVQRREHVPLVGRKQEWQQLLQAWQEMGSRSPQMVTIWGEAGVGKTRLVEEFIHWASLRPGTAVYPRAYAAEGALAYAPLTEWLRSEIVREGVARLEKLWRSEIARLLPEVLIEQPDLPAPIAMSEGWQRQRFFEALARALLAVPQPLLLVLDDMQWCDGETLAWLRYLLRFSRQTSLLVVATVRSEEVDAQHPLREVAQQLQREGQYKALELTPLSAEETAVLAGHISHENVTDWAAQLYRETEGNPLFVVEMVRAGVIGGRRERQEGEATVLPATVQAVIAARLDQLTLPARQMAELAATIGRGFTTQMLAAASNVSTGTIVQALDELWRRRIVRERGNGYDFSHDKIRDVAYATVSPMRRRLLHLQVAEGLEQLYAQTLNEVAGQLATHYRQADEGEKALTYLVQAGDHARHLSAKQEALRYYHEGLALAQGEAYYGILAKRAKVYLDLYQGREAVSDFQHLLSRARQSKNREQEMTFLLGLVNAYYLVALDAQERDAAQNVLTYFLAAQALARELGDKRNIVLSLLLPIWHFWSELREESIANSQEALALSRELGDEALIIESKLALLYNSRNHAQAKVGDEVIEELQARQDFDRLNQATFYLMWTHYNLGNYSRAVAFCNAGIELTAKLGILPVQYPTLKAFALLRLGRYAEAWESLQEEIADEAHRLARAFKAVGTGMYLFEVGAYRRAASILEDVIKEAEQLQRDWLREWARIWLVRSLVQTVQLGDLQWTMAAQILADADQEVLKGLDQWQALAIVVQAEMAFAEERSEEALQLVQKAVVIMEVNEFQGDLAVALELQARVLLRLCRPAEALPLLKVAYEIATNASAYPVTWRIHATTAQVLEMLGQIQAATQEWQLAADIIARLAANIDDEELRQEFLLDMCRASVLSQAQNQVSAS